MIHHRCVDTAVLFPHPQGPPYRRALRALSVFTCVYRDNFTDLSRRAKECLGQTIQAGGAAGHSSLEDSIATLNIVRWYIANRPKRAPPAG